MIKQFTHVLYLHVILTRILKFRYWHEHYFKAIQIIKEASEKAGLTMAEVALRWISHHSLLKREFGDAVLIGASSLKHIEQNLTDFEKGPLRKQNTYYDVAIETLKNHVRS